MHLFWGGKMIEVIDNKMCYGCGSCVASCPNKCIELVIDSEGFLYPIVNKAKCTQCNLCEKKCPMISDRTEQKKSISAYAAINNDDNARRDSSSGGIFTVLAQFVIKNKGVIFGAAYDRDFTVKHILIEDEKELFLLRGSKYVQSDMHEVFESVKSILETGRFVLFTGTACQVEALETFLDKEYNNLLTVDVLCHGVPSPYIWRKYVLFQEECAGARLKSVNFRDKRFGWNLYSIKMVFENGKIYSKVGAKDIYIQMFLKNLTLRPSCYSCKYRTLKRSSDLTIGDLWGAYSKVPKMDDDKGLSLVLINSNKGKTNIENIKDMISYKKLNPREFLPDSYENQKIISIPKLRRHFFEDASSKSITDLYDIYIKAAVSKPQKLKVELKIAIKFLRHCFIMLLSKFKI